MFVVKPDMYYKIWCLKCLDQKIPKQETHLMTVYTQLETIPIIFVQIYEENLKKIIHSR